MAEAMRVSRSGMMSIGPIPILLKPNSVCNRGLAEMVYKSRAVENMTNPRLNFVPVLRYKLR